MRTSPSRRACRRPQDAGIDAVPVRPGCGPLRRRVGGRLAAFRTDRAPAGSRSASCVRATVCGYRPDGQRHRRPPADGGSSVGRFPWQTFCGLAPELHPLPCRSGRPGVGRAALLLRLDPAVHRRVLIPPNPPGRAGGRARRSRGRVGGSLPTGPYLSWVTHRARTPFPGRAGSSSFRSLVFPADQVSVGCCRTSVNRGIPRLAMAVLHRVTITPELYETARRYLVQRRPPHVRAAVEEMIRVGKLERGPGETRTRGGQGSIIERMSDTNEGMPMRTGLEASSHQDGRIGIADVARETPKT